MREPFLAAEIFVHALAGFAGLAVVGLAFLVLAKIRGFFADHRALATDLAAARRINPQKANGEEHGDAGDFSAFAATLRNNTVSPSPSPTEPKPSSSATIPATSALAGSAPTSTSGSSRSRSSRRAEEESELNAKSARNVKNYWRDAPNLLSSMRGSFVELNRTRSERQRQEMLAHLAEQLSAFRKLTNVPELLPASQLAQGLQGLLTQLAGKPCDVTASALRTTAGALVLLESLLRTGFPADLVSNPPIRLLVVDDDAVSRVALAMALKKAFPLPDVAPAGESALVLAAKQTYDVMFLDVEMPGMNGFELCAKLRGTPLNHSTPVIFVTRHSDFESREKSTQSGAQDLIGKPFLPFEITVKALTFVFRSRLQRQGAGPLATTVAIKNPAEISASGGNSQGVDVLAA